MGRITLGTTCLSNSEPWKNRLRLGTVFIVPRFGPMRYSGAKVPIERVARHCTMIGLLKTVHLLDSARFWGLWSLAWSTTMVSTFRKWNFLLVECIHRVGLFGLGPYERGISWKNA